MHVVLPAPPVLLAIPPPFLHPPNSSVINLDMQKHPLQLHVPWLIEALHGVANDVVIRTRTWTSGGATLASRPTCSPQLSHTKLTASTTAFKCAPVVLPPSNPLPDLSH